MQLQMLLPNCFVSPQCNLWLLSVSVSPDETWQFFIRFNLRNTFVVFVIVVAADGNAGIFRAIIGICCQGDDAACCLLLVNYFSCGFDFGFGVRLYFRRI